MKICSRCNTFIESLICNCIIDKDKKLFLSFINTFRKRNEIIIYSTPIINSNSSQYRYYTKDLIRFQRKKE